MHTTIAIPEDVSIPELARALAGIGLRCVPSPGRVLAFDHGPVAPGTCAVAGCERQATTRDGARAICARHWIDARSEA